MKNLRNFGYVFAIVAGMAACSNPQEKAENLAEDATVKADETAANAAEATGIAAENTAAAVIYSNIAAASEAASKIAMPALTKTESKNLAKSLGDLIVKRIGAATPEDAAKYDDDIIKERAKVEQAATDNKIPAEEKDAILKYGDDMIAAAKAAVGL